MVNSRFSKQWFCDRKAMKELSVHGGGAVFARISWRFGRLLQALGIFLGIDTVKGRGAGETSLMVILVSSSSPSTVEVVGEDAVEDDVRIDNA